MKTVLFIGNSFTYVNDLPGMLTALAREAGFEIETEAVVRGGWYLNRFADPEDPMGQQLRQVFPTRKWDYIVLQDQSFNPAGNQADFLAAVEKLTGMMRTGARFLLYQTWAYQDASEKLAAAGRRIRPEQRHAAVCAYRLATPSAYAMRGTRSYRSIWRTAFIPRPPAPI